MTERSKEQGYALESLEDIGISWILPKGAAWNLEYNVPLFEEYRRRIVACVNYCEGVSTAEIEAAPSHLRLDNLLHCIDADLPKYTAKRDRLAALLEETRKEMASRSTRLQTMLALNAELVKALDYMVYIYGGPRDVRTVLAKAKEGA